MRRGVMGGHEGEGKWGERLNIINERLLMN